MCVSVVLVYSVEFVRALGFGGTSGARKLTFDTFGTVVEETVFASTIWRPISILTIIATTLYKSK